MGTTQTPLPEQLQKYIGELSNHAFNVKTPRTHVKTERVITDLMTMLLNSQQNQYQEHGIIIDGDQLTKDAYNKGMKIYQQNKTRLHTLWALFTTSSLFLLTIILVEFN
jgi:hypothetical protein